MKSIACVLALVASASAYQAPTMMAKRGKASPAPAPVQGVRSAALPFTTAPPSLDGSMIGDVGFDPLGLSMNTDYMPFESIKWYREAELQHGRVAQLAWLGFVFPNIYHFPSDATHNFGELNALAAVRAVPQWGLVQLAVFVGALEAQRYAKCIKGDNAAGDVGLGQGGFNPFGFEYTQEEYEEKQLQEIKHCRLAMLGVLGVWWQGILSGQGVIQQIGGAFDAPDYYGKAGYYFPDGI
eukprot:CAMPEP_0182522968 /NCGR_PEP_ID=MMETSP1323-20130603/692_1 /TAXON_ID=236787 /ORGANISM="Florenciella parvula, Strain RCC1693" /LENGTH=238 /DNA_ID=CAMNT_0024731219 /DNA_START=56 /DNA_END=772 /DNA_ORIENTATION=+